MTLFGIVESRIVPFSVKFHLDDSIPLSVFSEFFFFQILPLFSWKSLCLLNPLLEIPLYLSKLNVAPTSWIISFASSFECWLAWFPDCLVSLLLLLHTEMKLKDLLIIYESKWVRESPWKLSAYTLTFSLLCHWVEFCPLNFCLLTTLGKKTKYWPWVSWLICSFGLFWAAVTTWWEFTCSLEIT